MFKNIKAKREASKAEKAAYTEWHSSLSTEELASLYMAKREQRKDRAVTFGASALIATAIAGVKIIGK